MNSAVAAAKPARPTSGRGLAYAPILRASHDQIRELGARRSTSLSHVQRAVEGDPAVALNLFADVNAHLKRAGHAPVGDIPRAILFMGMADLPGRISQASILEDVVPPALCEDLVRMLCRAHHAARQARAIGALSGGINGDELLAASLVREGLPFVEILTHEPGIDLNVTAFSNFLPATPDSHDAEVLQTKCLDLGARFADATQDSWDETALNALYVEIADLTGRAADDVAKRLRLATVDAARAGLHFNAYLPAIRLMSPGERPVTPSSKPRPVVRNDARAAVAEPQGRQEPLPSPPAASHKPEAKSKRCAPEKPATSKRLAQGNNQQAPPVKNLSECLGEIAEAAAHGASAAALLPLALTSVCAQSGMKLALLFMRDKNSPDLRLRIHRGLEVPAKYQDVPIVLADNPLLAKLMTKSAAFQWAPDKHATALAGLASKLMGKQTGFFYSLHVDDKPLGIIVGCRPLAERDTRSDFEAFKRIGAAAREALQHSRRDN